MLVTQLPFFYDFTFIVTFIFTGSFIWLNVSIINLFISPIVMVFGLYQCYQYTVSWRIHTVLFQQLLQIYFFVCILRKI